MFFCFSVRLSLSLSFSFLFGRNSTIVRADDNDFIEQQRINDCNALRLDGVEKDFVFDGVAGLRSHQFCSAHSIYLVAGASTASRRLPASSIKFVVIFDVIAVFVFDAHTHSFRRRVIL